MEYDCSSNCAKKHLHGVSRSLVRRIGSSLPINTGQRVYIQLPSVQSPESEHSEFKYAATGQVYHSASTSDGLTLASHFEKPDSSPMENDAGGNLHQVPYDVFAEDNTFDDVEESSSSELQKTETLQKITALETELASLKAQIAAYALSESHEQQFPPPPPPPPLPGTMPTKSKVLNEKNCGTDISEAASMCQDTCLKSTATVINTPANPQMVDVLKDIGSVRLRAVNAVKSPGGTPLRHKRVDIDAANNDPAAIIAQALRKKFSHNVFQDSPDKENLDRSDSSLYTEFDSPTVKLFSS